MPLFGFGGSGKTYHCRVLLLDDSYLTHEISVSFNADIVTRFLKIVYVFTPSAIGLYAMKKYGINGSKWSAFGP